MFYPDSSEEKTLHFERRLQEEKERFDEITCDVEQQLSGLGITKEQVLLLLSDKDNFTEKDLNQIEVLRRDLDRSLGRSEGAISDPRRAKKARSELKDINRNWLFVR